MTQYIHLISNTVASNPLDVWTPSTNNLKPQRGHQGALGLFKNFRENDIETSVEVYYRRTTDQVEYIDGADILINEFLEGDLLSGRGRAYGMEFSLRKNYGKLTGFASYTLARTELQTDGINNNEWYPTRFDQTHNLKISGFYDLNQRITFSANFTYITGTPTTYPNARYEQRVLANIAIPYLEGEQRNNVRIGDFHRLDISMILRGRKMKNGKKRKNEDYWVFSVYNVYSRRNPFSEYFAQDQTVRTTEADPYFADTGAYKVSIIGTIFPAISYNFKF
jgi:hypothetical protein